MWTYLGKVIRVGRGWTDAEGVKHPATWNRWTDAEKTAHGLVWDQSLQPVPFDNRFYWSAGCLLYTSPSPRDGLLSRMPSSA